MKHFVPRCISVLLFLTLSSAARACTVCDSANGHALRSGLLDGHFIHTLLLVAAPAPALAAAVALLHVFMPDISHGEPE